jgi:hypothetical protein
MRQIIMAALILVTVTGYRMSKCKNDKKLDWKRERWEVICVTEGRKTWYEVRSGALVASTGYGATRFHSATTARRDRDKLQKQDDARAARREDVL